MTTTRKIPESDYGTNKVPLAPARSFQIPGGPYRRSLEPPTLPVLAEIERGGDDDAGVGSRR